MDEKKLEELLEQLSEELGKMVERSEPSAFEVAIREIADADISKQDRRRYSLSRKEVEAMRFGLINGIGIVGVIADEPDFESMVREARGFIGSAFRSYVDFRDLDYDLRAWLEGIDD